MQAVAPPAAVQRLQQAKATALVEVEQLKAPEEVIFDDTSGGGLNDLSSR